MAAIKKEKRHTSSDVGKRKQKQFDKRGFKATSRKNIRHIRKP